MPGLFQGVIPALVTPYKENGQINYDSATELVERLIRDGIGGLFVCGSTGEWHVLSMAERKRYAEHIVKVVKGRVKVMVHCCALATRDAISLARHAEKIGADAISSLPPIGSVYSEAVVWEFFEDIAKSVSLPMYLYHIPQLFGEMIKVDTFARKAEEIPNLAGVKFSSYRIDDMVFLRQKTGDRLNILSGCGEQSLSAMMCGAEGSICTWYNLIPRLFVKMMECVRQRKQQQAQEYYQKAMEIIGPIHYWPLGAAKWLLGHRGISCGRPRKPLPDMPFEKRESILEHLKKINAFDWFV